MLRDDRCNSLERGHVCGSSSADTTVLGGSVHGDQDDISFSDALGDVGGEEQVGLARRHVCGTVVLSALAPAF